jgi:hypothetical protein
MRNIFIVWLIVTVIGFSLMYLPEYNKLKPRDVTIVKLYIEPAGYKQSSHPVAVYEFSDGLRIDQHISYSYLSQIKEGDKVTISLRDFDIKQNFFSNVFFVFFPILLLSTSGAMAFIGFFMSIMLKVCK